VNSSAGEVAEVPTGVVTSTSTVLADSAGLDARISVDEMTAKLVEGVDPKFTAVESVNPLPEMVIADPPAVAPPVGLMAVTTGAASNVNWSADDVPELPSGVVTVRSTVPEPAALTAVIDVDELTV
jgi:hypothetical protein